MSERNGILGAVLAGGRSRRYGSPKALARVGGVRLIERAVQAVAAAADCTVIVASEQEPYGYLGLPVRGDERPDTGPLGGIHAAVRWARMDGFAAALVVACDMPFVPAGLLRELASHVGPAAVSVPASPSRRGLEPLCAAYGTECLAAIESALDRGDRSVISFFEAVDVRILPLQAVSRWGDPSRLFYNVNRPQDRRRAERWAADRATSEDGE